jgi:hypothetical protein
MLPVELTAAPLVVDMRDALPMPAVDTAEDMPEAHVVMPVAHAVIAVAPKADSAAVPAVDSVVVAVMRVAASAEVTVAAAVMRVVASVPATRVAAATAAVDTGNIYDFPSPERPVCFGRRAFCVGMKTNRGWSSSWYPRSQCETWATHSSMPDLA